MTYTYTPIYYSPEKEKNKIINDYLQVLCYAYMELTIGGKLYLYTFACKFYFEVIIIIIIIDFIFLVLISGI